MHSLLVYIGIKGEKKIQNYRFDYRHTNRLLDVVPFRRNAPKENVELEDVSAVRGYVASSVFRFPYSGALFLARTHARLATPSDGRQILSEYFTGQLSPEVTGTSPPVSMHKIARRVSVIRRSARDGRGADGGTKK